MSKQTDPILAIGEVRGLLRGFEWFNTRVNYGPTYTFERLAPHASLDEALNCYFDGDTQEIQLTPMGNWQTEVRSVLAQWLFAYCDSGLPPGVGAVGDSRSQDEQLDHFMELFQGTLRPRAVWKVDVKLDSFYELLWDDLVFECASGAYFLHLGMSD